MSNAQVLPPDHIVEILSWLPVKALVRFRCVAKIWNSLMFHPTFIKLHLQRSQKNNQLLLVLQRADDVMLDTIPYPVQNLLENPSLIVDFNNCPKIDSNFLVIGACNGLVCIFKFDLENCLRKEYGEYRFQMWNPATRVMSQDSPPTRSTHFRLSFYVGFGYDDRNDTYKVALLPLDIKSQQREVLVYTFGDTCWKKILTCPAFRFHRDFGISLNGTINWLTLCNLSLNKSLLYDWKTISTINDVVIFSYDLKNERYKLFSMPVGLSEVPYESPGCAVLKGCLCLYHIHKQTHFVIWQMRELGVENSWTQLLNVCLQDLQIQIHDLKWTPACEPICMSKDEDIFLLGVEMRLKLIVYNQRNKIQEGNCIYNCFHWFEHVQSLVLPY